MERNSVKDKLSTYMKANLMTKVNLTVMAKESMKSETKKKEPLCTAKRMDAVRIVFSKAYLLYSVIY